MADRKQIYVPDEEREAWDAVSAYAENDSRWGSMASFVRDAVFSAAARLGLKLPKREG